MHICCLPATYKIRFLHVEAIIKYIAATESKILLNEKDKITLIEYASALIHSVTFCILALCCLSLFQE